ncbi:hypothetical protein FQR65_LT16160 [Abscondita terminalis]|nr:hypothetical protein FQR65_LT16160 [Abscondita terminalis]
MVSEIQNKQRANAELYFRKVDAGEFDSGYYNLFTEDVELYFPKFGFAYGKAGIRKFGETMVGFLKGLTHDIGNFNYIISGNTVVVEGTEKGITIENKTFPDNVTAFGKFCNVFEFEDDLIKRVHIYADPDVTSEDEVRTERLSNNYGIDNLKLTEVPTPEVGENEVLVRTTAVSLQYLDLLTVENTLGLNIPLPFIPVSEGVGVVESVGIQTSGTLAEFTIQPENTLVRSPQNLSDEEATSLSVAGLTAWAMLVNQANIRAGQSILIQGSGGVSLAALQIAKMSGLKVIATTGSREKEQKLKDLGADDVINYKDFPDWSNEVKRLNNGTGVDVTLDVAGNKTINQSILSVKEHGFVGLVGFMSGSKLTFDVFPLIMNYIRLQGYSVGNAQELNELVNAIEVNNFKPVIDSIYNINQTQEAFLKLKSDGKLIELKFAPTKGVLHAPKGMTIENGILYVADLERIVGFDINSQKTVFELTIPEAKITDGHLRMKMELLPLQKPFLEILTNVNTQQIG